MLNLLSQFLHYSVEQGGNFHTPHHGIARSSSLSPLLAAFHLYHVDCYFAQNSQCHYIRYMDDFIILTRTRWHLKRAVKQLNGFLAALGFSQHPNKTFIGHIAKGFDWMGFWFTQQGCQSVAPRAQHNHHRKLNRLLEQVRKLPAKQRAIRTMSYLTRWYHWQDTFFDALTSWSQLPAGTQSKIPAAQPEQR
ncbi:reverse transcriptase domain-containing protein [Aeromonas sp. 102P]|uniref:reverse transcriptase domain-containing protein n=1 Tax=Aeromonas sp. 102P TaxID=3452711 RepID=UPI003F7AB360